MRKRKRDLCSAMDPDVPGIEGTQDWLSDYNVGEWVEDMLNERDGYSEYRLVESGWAVEDGRNDNFMSCLKLSVRIRGPYVEVGHYVKGACCVEMMHRDEAICIRRRAGSRWATMTAHLVGECPALDYE
jgi:hypothetical protein